MRGEQGRVGHQVLGAVGVRKKGGGGHVDIRGEQGRVGQQVLGAVGVRKKGGKPGGHEGGVGEGGA